MPNKVVDVLMRMLGKDDGASAAMDAVGRKAESTAAKVRDFARGGDEGAALKGISRLLRGGGAAMGVTLIAKGINDLAVNMNEFAEACRKGEADFGAFVEKAAGSIPIFGQVWAAGRALRNSIQDLYAEHVKNEGGSEGDIRAAMSDETLAKIDKANDEILKAEITAAKESHAKLLAVNATTFENQRAQAKAEFDKSTEEINKYKEANKTLWESNQGGARANVTRMSADANATLAAKNAKIDKEEAESRKAIIEAGERTLSDARSKALQDRLRSQAVGIHAEDMMFRAEAEGIRHGYDKLIEAAAEAANKQMDKDPANRVGLSQMFWKLKSSYDAEAASEIGSAAEAIIKARGAKIGEEMQKAVKQYTERQSVAGELAGLHLEAMKQSGDMSDAHEKETRRVEVAEQYRKEHEQILNILRSETATSAQKVEATKRESDLRVSAARELKALREVSYANPDTFEMDTNVGGTFYAPQAHPLRGLNGSDADDKRMLDDAGRGGNDPLPGLVQKLIDNTDPDKLSSSIAKGFADYLKNVVAVASGTDPLSGASSGGDF